MDEFSCKTRNTKIESDVISFYDDYAESWDSRFFSGVSTEYFLEHRWRAFEKILPKNTENLRVLELGVGTGIYISRLSKKFKEVVAVDGSKQMLEQLKKKISALKLKNVSYLQSSVTNLKLDGEQFDVVCFFGLIEHVIEKDLFLKEMKRVLKPGGLIIGVMPNAKCPWYSLKKFFNRVPKHCTTDNFHDLSEIKVLSKKCGLALVDKCYWGLVPAGINSKFVFKSLVALERIWSCLVFLKCYMGGVVFSLKKDV